MLPHEAEAILQDSLRISHYFATKRYIHGTSNLFPCFLLPMTSQVARPPCLRECQNFIFVLQYLS